MGNATHALMNSTSLSRGPSQTNNREGKYAIIITIHPKNKQGLECGIWHRVYGGYQRTSSYVRLVENSGKLFDVAAPSKESAARAHSLLAKSQ